MIRFTNKFFSVAGLVPTILCAFLLPANAIEIEAQTTDNTLKVRYLGQATIDSSKEMQWELLRLALDRSGQPYDLGVSTHQSAPLRGHSQMQNLGDEANIMWLNFDSDNERTMRPIRIPLFRGLYRYWNIWVRKENLRDYSELKTIDDLAGLSVLQGRHWRSVPVLEANGIEVRTGDMANLTKMLAHGRADMLLYPVVSSHALIESFQADEYALFPVPNTLIAFPLDNFFFLARDGSEELHAALLRGMTDVVNDGSHDALLRSHPATKDGYRTLLRGDFNVLELQYDDMSAPTREAMSRFELKIQ